ncbi:MAG: hypothetical protein CBD97_00690 [Pelagibacteraceae bacterium TMED237]|nr:hypothetical protein [Candidatus Neomarinimicrobiota bacterium]OUW96736.1 MAG: hypothetical protein CBD97_00690 [Pelagibacteraceae bacterium TMED237]|tara:strand:+ start:5165 stop:5725 length:561 start_codon:yes stop_codon:yes gene_type:complete
MNNKLFNNLFLIIILTLIGIGSRLMPHPPNITAVGAVALFLGSYSKKNNLFFLVPFGIMFISDLSMYYYRGTPFPGTIVYLCLLAYIPIGSYLIRQITVKNIILSSLSGATLFFFITNFSVWINSGGVAPYTYNFSGLINCYIAAIPFYANSVAGNLIWCSFIFGSFETSKNLLFKKSLASNTKKQ